MKAMRTLGAVPTIATVGVALLLVPSARACDDSPRGLGDHPAVVVQRLYKAAGYDYASKFYPYVKMIISAFRTLVKSTYYYSVLELNFVLGITKDSIDMGLS